MQVLCCLRNQDRTWTRPLRKSYDWNEQRGLSPVANYWPESVEMSAASSARRVLDFLLHTEDLVMHDHYCRPHHTSQMNADALAISASVMRCAASAQKFIIYNAEWLCAPPRVAVRVATLGSGRSGARPLCAAHLMHCQNFWFVLRPAFIATGP